MEKKIKYARSLGVKLLRLMLLVGLLVGGAGHSWSQTMLPGPEIARAWSQRADSLPGQWTHLQLGQTRARVGDSLLFSAFLTQGPQGRLDTADSQPIYVELVNAQGLVSLVLVVESQRGRGHGALPLPDSLPAGPYLLRAYTHAMRGYPDGLMFRQEIELENPGGPPLYYHPDAHRRLAQATRHPERPHWQVRWLCPPVAGLPNQLGLRMTDAWGRPLAGRAVELLDGREVLAQALTDAMGYALVEMEEMPAARRVEARDERSGQGWKGPKTDGLGWVWRAELEQGLLRLELRTNLPGKTLGGWILQHQGQILASRRMELADGLGRAELSLDSLPAGLCQVAFFDSEGAYLGQRMIWVERQEARLEARRDGSRLELLLEDAEGRPLAGSLTLMLLRDTSGRGPDIREGLGMVGPLGQALPGPDAAAINRQLALHDWPPLDWEQMDKGRPAPARGRPERGLGVSGRVTRPYLEIPEPESQVSLFVTTTYNDRFTQTTGTDGRFRFEGLDYADTIDVVIQARDAKGSDNVLILLDTLAPPPANFMPLPNAWVPRRQRQAVVEYQPVSDSVTQGRKLHGTPDQVLIVDQQTASSYTSTLQMVRERMPGRVSQRIGSYQGDPLYLIDGTVVGRQAIDALSPFDVERVELLNEASAAIYGSWGGRGVVAVFTHQGQYGKRGEIDFRMLGFHRPKLEMPYQGDGAVALWMPRVDLLEGRATLELPLLSEGQGLWLWLEGVGEQGQRVVLWQAW